MIISRKTLQLFEHLARNAFVDTPANLQFADDAPLTPSEFRQFVLLKTALGVLKSMDTDINDMEVELSEPYKP